MKGKIIYFTNVPTDLQVAKFLQDNELEVYGILDIPDMLRKTFEEQEIIKFKKKWDYREFVKKEISGVDTQFLEEFEKKYEINLWSLIYKDRNLYGFNDYYDFDYNEILKITEKSIRFCTVERFSILPLDKSSITFTFAPRRTNSSTR